MSSELDDKLLFLKEELLKEVRFSENKILDVQMGLKIEFIDKFNNVDQKLEVNTLRFESLQEKDTSLQIKVLENFPSVVTKAENNAEDIFHQNIKLTSLQKDLESAIKKYDNMIMNNLFIPGTIGQFCPFKNLREYIEVNFI